VARCGTDRIYRSHHPRVSATVRWEGVKWTFYVKDFISDGDYRTLRKNLIDVAKAHAAHVRQL
jgi:hypothetical protein